MKRLFLILKTLILFLIIPSYIHAYDFEVDGLCYNKISSDQVEVTYRKLGDRSYSGEIKIPRTVTHNNKNYIVSSIGYAAFDYCKNLTGSLILPNTIITIEAYAFNGCSGLTGSLAIPNSVTSIGSSAFSGCSGFSGSLTIPNSVKTIGSYAFQLCSGFTGSLTIPNSVTSINNSAFSGCSGFTGSLTIPSSVTFIDFQAFLDCHGFTGSLAIPNSVKEIGGNAFMNCSSFTSLTLSNSVVSIGNSAFHGCSGLTGSLVIPNSLITINQGAFSGCSGFSGSLTIPNSVTEIEAYAFYDCIGFTSLSISDAITSIGDYAFYNCRNLSLVKSELESPFEISNNVFQNISSNSVLQIPFGTKNKYQSFLGWTKNFKSIIEQGGVITYTLSIKAVGNGQVTYNGTKVKNDTKSFTLNEGTSATITISSDNGYRIKSVKVNNSDVTSKVSNNSYTISSISANTTVEVVFEAIPIPTYTLTIKSTGNGSATYNGTTAKNNTQTFSLNEGSSAKITFTPDNGYRIKSVKVNNVDVTSSVSNNQYTVSSIKTNTTVDVVFEAIPITTYTLTIKATGNGSASYSGTTAKNNTKAFTLNEGTSATIIFAPDNGYRIKSVKVNSTDVSSSVSNNQYTVSNIKVNTTVEVQFEAIPITTYALTIKATGSGSATYSGTTAKNNTKSFTLHEGTSATITFTPDNGYRIKSVKVNNVDVTSSVSNNQYTVRNIKANTTVDVQFEAIPITTYALTIKATGSGSATYSGTTAKNNTKSFTLHEGTSATITFTPDNGYRIKSVKVNNVDVTSKVSNNQYTISSISANITIEVEFEAIPVVDTTYTLTINITGNGWVTYTYKTFRDETTTFTIKEGESATISFSPDEGWQIKSVIVNDIDVTSQVSNNKYTISNINKNTTIDIEYEATLQPTYTLTIQATGNGSVWYGTSVRSNTESFTVDGGSSPIITFLPDDGYQVKSVVVNSVDITSQVSNNQYTISSINVNTTMDVEFDLSSNDIIGQEFEFEGIRYKIGENKTVSVIQRSQKYSGDVVIPSHVSYNGVNYTVTTIASRAFANYCTELTSITIPPTVTSIESEAFFDYLIHFTAVHITDLKAWCNINYGEYPEDTCPLKWAKHLYLNGELVKDLVIPSEVTSINKYTFAYCSDLTSITIPNSVMSIGEYAFYRCSGLTSIVSEINNPFEISDNVFLSYDKDIYAAATLIVPVGTKSLYQSTAGWNKFQNIVERGEEEPDLPGQIHINDIYYKVTESGEAEVVSVEEGEKSVIIPSTISHNNNNYKVTSIAKEVFENREHLAAVIWEPEAQFNATVNNPNFLLYVSDEKYASHTVKNVVVNGVAERIELADAANGNDFYCPRAFKAKNISYSHNYQMETGFGDSKGWETIVLPFDVQKYTHATKGELESFTTWRMGSNKKPFWLFELTADGYKDVADIKSNTPYIISMPNNRQYEQQYQIPGIVTFSATNVEVKKSDDMKSISYKERTFVPNYTNQNNLDYLPLNVNSNYVTYLGADAGSKFIGGLRSVHPFEAYMTTTDGTRSIDVLDGMTTAIKDIYMIPDDTEVIRVYDTKGVLVKAIKANDDLRRGLAAGIYIVNGKKIIVK